MEKFKVGDRVKWSGSYISGYLKGIGKIKSIEYSDLFKRNIIILYNGKIFSENKNNLKKVTKKNKYIKNACYPCIIDTNIILK